MNIDRNSRLMAVSGALGFAFFLISNFTHLFTGLNLVAGIIQIAINIFVFITWKRGFIEAVEMTRDNLGPIKAILIALIEILTSLAEFLTRQNSFRQSLMSKAFVSAFGVVVPVVLASITTGRVIIPSLLNALSHL